MNDYICSMSSVVIIGSGNVAYHLAKAFSGNGIDLVQVFGRNTEALKQISEEMKVEVSTTQLKNADIYVISVNDDAVEEVSKQIKTDQSLVVHTSGSLPISILKGKYRKGSFYPLQTFSKLKSLHYDEIPFFVNAQNEKDLNVLKELASKISKNVMKIDDEKKKYIHLTAVFACNFVNHLYANAKEISDSQNIPFNFFLPLIDETTSKIHSIEPREAQTGPARRNDVQVLKAHEELLKEDEKMKIYKVLNESIKKMYEL